MLPEELKQKLDADLADAAARGDDALEETAGGLAETLNKMAEEAASATEAQFWFAAARHVLDAALARLPGRWRLHLQNGRALFSWSRRIADADTQLKTMADAVRCYRCILELQPNRHSALGNLAVLLKHYGDIEPDQTAKLHAYNEAEKLYRRLFGLQPKDWRAMTNLGVLLKDRIDLDPSPAARLAAYGEAESLYRRALEMQPSQVETIRNLGQLLHDRGDLELAVEQRIANYLGAVNCYYRLMHIAQHNMDEIENAILLLIKIADLSNDYNKKNLIYENAKKLCNIALELQPDRVGVLGNFAIVIKNSGDIALDHKEKINAYTEAEKIYRRIIYLTPGEPKTYANLGLLIKDRADLEPSKTARIAAYGEAESFYRRALEMAPDDTISMNNLGLLMIDKKNLEPKRDVRISILLMASSLFEHALKINPNFVQAVNNYGLVFRALGDLEIDWMLRFKAYKEADSLFRRVLDLSPDDVRSLNNLALLLKDIGDLEPSLAERLVAYEEAERLYRQVLRLQPEYIPSLVNYASLIKCRGDLEAGTDVRLAAYAEAETGYKRVLGVQPDHVGTLANLAVLELGRARLEKGERRRRHLTEAATLSARVLDFQPTEPKAMRNFMNARLQALVLEDDATGWSQRARDAAELLERRQVFAAVTRDPQFRTELSSAAWPLGPLGAVCHLRAGDPAAAVAHLDANMAMSLAEALALPERRLAALERQGHGDAANAYLVARDTLNACIQERVDLLQAPKGDTAESEAARRDQIEALGREMERLQQVVDDAIAAIRLIDGFADFLHPESGIEVIKAAAKERPMVYLCDSPWGGHALVVHGETIDDIALDNLTDAAVAERLEAWQATYSTLRDTRGNRLRRGTRFPDTKSNSADPEAAARAFDATTRGLCRWLGEAVMTPLLAALARAGHDHAVLLPAGQLSYLPLHAAIVGGSDERPELALAKLQLGYAANARMALASRDALGTTTPTPPRLAALLDPEYGDGGPPPLAGCRQEQKALERLQGEGRVDLRCHAGAEALVAPPGTTKGAFPVAELAEQTILHLACHGAADHADVFNSCLVLAPGPDDTTHQAVPVASILDTWPLDRLRLVVLSCCEGAMSGRQSFDELVSLQTAFAQAGAASVVGAMWAVRDDHTAELMDLFYQALLTDPALDPARALATAQAALLATAPDAFPTIAAFQVLQG